MEQYIELMKDIYNNGSLRVDRTGTGTKALFGKTMDFDLREGFPVVTEKYTWLKGVWVELLWMLKGTEDATMMLENNVHIWDEWLKEDNTLGRVYGVQWRNWRKFRIESLLEATLTGHVDQIAEVIRDINSNPHSRRLIVSAWNPGELDQMALPPCPILDQFFVDGEWLDMQAYQRSADAFLGLPFDIASKATLLSMVAQVTGKKPRMLHYRLGDAHIYLNHMEQTEILIERTALPLPKLWLNPDIKHIDDFKLSDIRVEGYTYHPAIKADVSV